MMKAKGWENIGKPANYIDMPTLSEPQNTIIKFGLGTLTTATFETWLPL